jgi:putative ABC transport system substrate-binding protein
MQRRHFMSLLVGATNWPIGAGAQQKKLPLMGFLGATSPSPSADVAAFQTGLSEFGFIDGQNLASEYRWAGGHYDRLPGLASELVGLKVDVIAAQGVASARAAKDATSTIPIAFLVSDPIGAGLVASLARPGGNLTGVAIIILHLVPKRLELISELVPQAREIALLVNPTQPTTERVTRDAEDAARAKGVQLHVVKAASENEIDAAFAALARRRSGALLVGTDPFLDSRIDQLVSLAASHAVPAIYSFRDATAAGGLISYGPSFATAYKEMGVYVGKLLKGAKPSDLPVEQPTKLELVINLKTAKALGLAVPQSILQRADEIIE